MKTMRKFLLGVFGVFALVSASSMVWAETYEVKGAGVKFDPPVIFAKAGDTIAFRNMASHFVNSVSIPDGADSMSSDMGADYSYVVKTDGVYFYKCPPHWGVRMGGLIVVGDASGLPDTLADMRAKTNDKVAQGFLKKVQKQIKKGKIKLP